MNTCSAYHIVTVISSTMSTPKLCLKAKVRTYLLTVPELCGCFVPRTQRNSISQKRQRTRHQFFISTRFWGQNFPLQECRNMGNFHNAQNPADELQTTCRVVQTFSFEAGMVHQSKQDNHAKETVSNFPSTENEMNTIYTLGQGKWPIGRLAHLIFAA